MSSAEYSSIHQVLDLDIVSKYLFRGLRLQSSVCLLRLICKFNKIVLILPFGVFSNLSYSQVWYHKVCVALYDDDQCYYIQCATGRLGDLQHIEAPVPFLPVRVDLTLLETISSYLQMDQTHGLQHR